MGMKNSESEKLAFQIPKRNINASKSRHKDWTTSVEAKSPRRLPNMFDVTTSGKKTGVNENKDITYSASIPVYLSIYASKHPSTA